ncbi:MAG: HAMP domain-containing sensor histidine kinase, partial [Finegoldia magna]|nr:HAMP domain-containing sensor histidine kinase [Finegoldia magna]
ILIKAESKTKDSIATNLILISKHSEGTYVSIYPYIFNSISDIKSTVISAFPVIFLLIVMIVFLLNKIYSKSITQPILKMNNFTKVSKNQKNAKYDLEIHTNDEIEELSNNLKSLYETLTENYKILEKNTKKKEIFIKSTSHELKTPLQTAILLNDSMIEKIGKYEDTDKYLPELRKKLYQIQILIDDLLFMNKIDENPIMENLKLSEIMRESVKNHHDLITEKNLKVTIKGEKSDIVDYDHFRIIFDNLLKNAIEYTDFGGNIRCDFNDVIEISNNPTTVDKILLNKITHPFVSSTKNKSKGIGMYIVENLLEDMNYKIKIAYSNETFTVKILKTN